MSWICEAMFLIIALSFVLVIWLVLQEIRRG